jgi:single-stranded-DNA-specific exonuclease
MEKIWRVKEQGEKQKVKDLATTLTIPEPIANLLVQRGIESYVQSKVFFRPTLDDLHDPFLMKDMDLAVERLERAIMNKEKILIYGDYDVDGTTSVALMYTFLANFHSQIEFYVPDRYSEGYGISFKGIDFAAENNYTLVIALDCGIKAVEKIEYANDRKIDFIICDHHTPGDSLPNALAVLDPKRADCEYPYKELSGCGVGFKLAQAFGLKNNVPSEMVNDLLDLVAVSIASDIVPITGENRILAYFGLKKLNNNPRLGLQTLMKVAGADEMELSITDVVFKLGPRINAAGRIDTADASVRLLISNDADRAQEIAQKINIYNTSRQNLDHSITAQALDMIDSDEVSKGKNTTVVYSADWHKGVIGIVASRLIESYYRPTVVLTESHGKISGSARSVEGFNLYEAIDACSHLLDSFGGHKFAAGLTLAAEKLEEFKECFEKKVRETISAQQLVPNIELDMEISFDEITPKFYRILNQMEPFGPENLSPIFFTQNVKATERTKIVGKTAEHLRVEVEDGTGIFQGIAFGMAGVYDKIKDGTPFDICYHVVSNTFNNRTSLQLFVKDIRLKE